MKIREILEQTPEIDIEKAKPTVARGDYEKVLDQLRRLDPSYGDTRTRSNVKLKGSGMYAAAFHKPTHSGTIRKVGYVPYGRTPEDDLYLKYLQFVAKHQDNPYVPKIYNFRLIKASSERRFYYVVDMEKLHLLHTLNVQQLYGILERMGQTERIQDLQNMRADSYDAARSIAGILERAALHGESEIAKFSDGKLRQVLTFLHTHENNIDMHSGNIMARITGHGTYPVITDPMA